MTFKADRPEPAVFRTMIQRGRGCALMHVLEYGLDGVEDIVLQACLTNQAHDPQSEHGRVPWLYRFFKDAPEYDRFSAAILEALPGTSEGYDQEQLCDLTALMGLDGDAEAASALRGFVLGQVFSEDDMPRGCQALVTLDGIPALAELGRRYGTLLLADPTAYVIEPNYLMEGFEEQPQHLAALDQLAVTDATLGAYLAHYRRKLAQPRPNLTPPERQAAQRERIRNQYSVTSILAAAVAGKGEYPGSYMTFGRHATAEELETVLAQLLTTSTPRVCQRLLWVFNRIAMPRIAPQVWELAQHEDEELRDAALSALSNMRDPAVGELGRRILRERGLGGTDASVLGLFTNNFCEGDAELILTHLDGLALTDDDAHGYSYRVVDICEKNDAAVIAGLAEWTYKSNPCSVCRRYAVERMIALNSLSPALAWESGFDADTKIQQLVQR
jgi:hypothetical protein